MWVALGACACGGSSSTGERPASTSGRSTSGGGTPGSSDALYAGTCYVIDLARGDGTFHDYPPAPPDELGGVADENGELGVGEARCRRGFGGDALDGALGALRACYDAATAAESPRPAGRLTVEALADGDGAVASARTHPAIDEAFAECVEAAARAVRFPRTASETAGAAVRPVVCAVHAPAGAPHVDARLELTPTSVRVDGRDVVDLALLQDPERGADFDQALTWLSAVFPPELFLPETPWTLALRAHPAITSDLVDLVLSYLEPTSVVFARGVGTSDEWQYINPAGTPGWGFCTVGVDEFTVRVELYAGGRAAVSDIDGTATELAPVGGLLDAAGLRAVLDRLAAAHPHRTDLVIVAPDVVPYRAVAAAIEAAVGAGFADAAFWADSYAGDR